MSIRSQHIWDMFVLLIAIAFVGCSLGDSGVDTPLPTSTPTHDVMDLSSSTTFMISTNLTTSTNSSNSTNSPATFVTNNPTKNPSRNPSTNPTKNPTKNPSNTPSEDGTVDDCSSQAIMTAIYDGMINADPDQGANKATKFFGDYLCSKFPLSFVKNTINFVNSYFKTFEKEPICTWAILNEDGYYSALIACREMTTEAPTALSSKTEAPVPSSTAKPSDNPTGNPIVDPTQYPSDKPTVSPIAAASNSSRVNATSLTPTRDPTNPTAIPTTVPTLQMPLISSTLNTNISSNVDSSTQVPGNGDLPQAPSVAPSHQPSNMPINPPTAVPSVTSNAQPTATTTGIETTIAPSVSPTMNLWYNDSWTTTQSPYLTSTGTSTQTMVIMAVIILGLCCMCVYCNRARWTIEKSSENQDSHAPTKKKKKGFSQLETSKSQSNSNDYNDYGNDFSSDENGGMRNNTNINNNNNNAVNDGSGPIDDRMVSQRVSLDDKSKKSKKNRKVREIPNGLMTRHRSEKSDKIRFSKVGANDMEDEYEDDDDSSEELEDDGMGNNPKTTMNGTPVTGSGATSHDNRKKKKKKSNSNNNNINNKGNVNINDEDLEEDDDFDSDGNGGVKVLPNPYAKNRKSLGFAGVIGEKFETFKSSVNQSVSKLNPKKENVVVIPMAPVSMQNNNGDNNNNNNNDSQSHSHKKKHKKQVRDYGRVGSGIRRKKSKQKNEKHSTTTTTKKQSQKTQERVGDSSDSGNNENDNGNGKGGKGDVFKICENDNVSDDYNITDSDGSTSKSSDGDIPVRLNKFGRGIKQPVSLASITNKKSKPKNNKNEKSVNADSITHGNGVPKEQL